MYFIQVIKGSDVCVFVEQDLAESEARLRSSTEEQRGAKEELETCRSEIQILQGSLATERERAETLISFNLTDRDKHHQAEVKTISSTLRQMV